jgi:hypothetical protein
VCKRTNIRHSDSVHPDHERLILDLLVVVPGGRATRATDEFLRQWPATDGVALGRSLLSEALRERDSDGVEAALIVCASFGFEQDHLPDLLELAQVDWHNSHEDVAWALDGLRTDAALPAFARFVEVRLPYLSYDDSSALAIKALHGLEHLGTREARLIVERAVVDSRQPVYSSAKRILARMPERT